MPTINPAIHFGTSTRANQQCIVFRHLMTLMVVTVMGATGCGTSKPAVYRDPELKQATEAAHAALNAGNHIAAVDLYTRGLTRARIMDDAGEITRTAYNLGVCLGAVGRYEDALRRLAEARNETRDTVQSGLIDLAEAKILLRMNRMDDCRQLLAAARTKLGADSPGSIAIQTQHISASLAIFAGDRGGARGALAIADPLIDKTTDIKLRGEHVELTARVLTMEGRNDEAGTSFEKAAGFYRQCGLYADMRLLLAAAAGAWQQGGKNDLAAELYFRAGRSHLSAGQTAMARTLLIRAAELATRTGNSALRTRALELAPPQ